MKENQNSISSMYNIRCDPCTCNSCIKQLELSWDKNEKDLIRRGIV